MQWKGAVLYLIFILVLENGLETHSPYELPARSSSWLLMIEPRSQTFKQLINSKNINSNDWQCLQGSLRKYNFLESIYWYKLFWNLYILFRTGACAKDIAD